MKYILLFIQVLIAQSGTSQIILFNDLNFKNRLIDNGVDLNSDGEIDISEAASVYNLDVSYGWNFNYISDLTEITYFSNLDTLNCSNNNISILDISVNNNLKLVDCRNNNISNLDLTNNLQLQKLFASDNSNLNALTFGTNPSLKEIYLNNIYVTNIIDFSGLPNLEILEFSHSPDLDVSSNLNLKTLLCRFTHGQINVSNNPNLETLTCSGQNELIISNSPLLKFLQCVGNAIKLDSINLTNNTLLVHLDLWQNNLSYIDLSQNTSLEFVELGYNHIPHIDFTNNINIWYLSCGGDSLKSLDLTGLIYLETLGTGNFLDSTSSNLNSIDLSTNINLRHLYCPAGNLTELDVSQNVLLEDIHFGYNLLDTLIICANPNINLLHFDGMPSLTHIFVPDPSLPPGTYSFGSPNWQFYNCNLLGVNDFVTWANDWQVYPNPATGKLFIGNFDQFYNISYEIIDIHSRIMDHGELISNSIDVGLFPNGIFLIKLKSSDFLLGTKRFIKE